jgi:hypothetical protein
MTETKQKKPGKPPAEVRRRKRQRQRGKPTVKQDTHDENVGQRESRDEPYVIKPLHEETE